jgi:hypothetical protein
MVSIQLHLLEHLMYYHLSICNYAEAKKVAIRLYVVLFGQKEALY